MRVTQTAHSIKRKDTLLLSVKMKQQPMTPTQFSFSQPPESAATLLAAAPRAIRPTYTAVGSFSPFAGLGAGGDAGRGLAMSEAPGC